MVRTVPGFCTEGFCPSGSRELIGQNNSCVPEMSARAGGVGSRNPTENPKKNEETLKKQNLKRARNYRDQTAERNPREWVRELSSARGAPLGHADFQVKVMGKATGRGERV